MLGSSPGPVNSDILPVDCPVCGEHLYLRPFNDPAYSVCYSCHHIFDPVLLHDAVTGTGHLPTSLDHIIQNGAVRSKPNSSLVTAYLAKICDPLAAYNRQVEVSGGLLASKKWLSTHGSLLMQYGIYPGASSDTQAVVSRNLLLWSKDNIPRSELCLGTPVTRTEKSHTGLLVPSWSKYGPGGFWFLSALRVSYCPSTSSELRSGGLAFAHDLPDGPVLATSDLALALKLQCSFHSRLKRSAPIVAYNSLTTREDWEMLGGRPVVFLDHVPLAFNPELLSAVVNCPESRLSPTLTKTLCDTRSVAQVSHQIGEALSNGVDAVEWFVNHKEYTRRHRSRLKPIITQDFISRAIDSHGVDTIELWDAGRLRSVNKAITLNGRRVEETTDGYAVVSGAGSELVSNFVLRLKKLYRYKESDKMKYDCDVHIGGAVISVELDCSTGTNRWGLFEQSLKKGVVDAGSPVIPYMDSKWVSRLHDIAMRFCQPPAEIVTELVGWDTQIQKFLLPKCAVTRQGKIEPLTWLGSGKMLTFSNVPESDEVQELYQAFGDVVTDLVVYTIYAVLYPTFSRRGRPKPLAIQLVGLEPSPVLEHLIRDGVRGMRLQCKRRFFPTDHRLLGSSLGVVEASNRAISLLGVADLAYVSTHVPKRVTPGNWDELVQTFDNVCVTFLSTILQETEAVLDFEGVQAAYARYLSGFGLAARPGIKSRMECLISYVDLTRDLRKIQEASRREGFEINEFVASGLCGVPVRDGKLVIGGAEKQQKAKVS